jgi:hypothetical protein
VEGEAPSRSRPLFAGHVQRFLKAEATGVLDFRLSAPTAHLDTALYGLPEGAYVALCPYFPKRYNNDDFRSWPDSMEDMFANEGRAQAREERAMRPLAPPPPTAVGERTGYLYLKLGVQPLNGPVTEELLRGAVEKHCNGKPEGYACYHHLRTLVRNFFLSCRPTPIAAPASVLLFLYGTQLVEVKS